MCEIIEFGSSKGSMIQKKLKRFNELKGWRFSDIITPQEEIELDEVQQWLIIHNI